MLFRGTMTARASMWALLLLLSAAAVAETPALPGSLVVQARRGRTVTGVVTDEAGRPVPAVEVEVLHNALTQSWQAPSFVEEAGRIRLRTGPGGRFHARDMPTGPLRLRIRRRGFVPIELDRALPPGREPFRLGRLVLRRGETLAGRVTDPEGRPLAGVAVWNSQEDYEEPFGDGPATLTGADGTFAVPGFAPRQWADLHFCAAGFLPGRAQIREVFPDPVAVVLQPAAFLSGRVSSPEGDPVPGARVHASRAGEEPSCFVEVSPCTPEPPTASAEGRFTLGPLQPGWYTVSARAPGFLSVLVKRVRAAAGPPLPELDLVLERGAVLAGRVLGPDGSPLSGVQVYALGRSAAEAVTGPDGGYRLDGVDVGRLEVVAQREGYEEAQRETETGPGENRLDFLLAPREDRNREVRGRVVDLAGRPIEGALVLGSSERVQTGPDGSWMLRLEVGGPWSVWASREGYAAAEVKVTVPDGLLDGVEVRLETGIAVSGRITGLADEDVAQVQVRARPSPGTSGSSGSGLLDGRGGYRIPDLGSGKWLVHARAGERSAASYVMLKPGQYEAEVDLAFRPVYEVRGWVTGPDGEPVAGADVTARRLVRNDVQNTQSRTDGSFSMRLGDGTYRLSASRAGYLPAELDGSVSIDGGPAHGVEIRLGRGVVLTGRLLGLEPGEVPHVSVNGTRQLRGEVDLDGIYRIADVGPGSWELTASLQLENSSYREVRARVQVAPDARQAVLDVDFALGDLTLSGRVLGDPGVPRNIQLLRDGMPVANIFTPPGDNTFRIPRLQPGLYKLRVFSPASGPLPEQDVVLAADQEVVVEIGEKAP